MIEFLHQVWRIMIANIRKTARNFDIISTYAGRYMAAFSNLRVSYELDGENMYRGERLDHQQLYPLASLFLFAFSV